MPIEKKLPIPKGKKMGAPQELVTFYFSSYALGFFTVGSGSGIYSNSVPCFNKKRNFDS